MTCYKFIYKNHKGSFFDNIVLLEQINNINNSNSVLKKYILNLNSVNRVYKIKFPKLYLILFFINYLILVTN